MGGRGGGRREVEREGPGREREGRWRWRDMVEGHGMQEGDSM